MERIVIKIVKIVCIKHFIIYFYFMFAFFFSEEKKHRDTVQMCIHYDKASSMVWLGQAWDVQITLPMFNILYLRQPQSGKHGHKQYVVMRTLLSHAYSNMKELIFNRKLCRHNSERESEFWRDSRKANAKDMYTGQKRKATSVFGEMFSFMCPNFLE